MTTFNLFYKLKYLPSFFGFWTLDIISTLDNMIIKVVDNNANFINDCTHNSKEMAFQCYGVETRCFYPTAAANNLSATWIMLTPQSWKITNANFYISQFKLIIDRYISLISQLNTQPLQLPYVKDISITCDETFGAPVAGAPGSITSVT
jgi:hypothetical protein